MDWFAFLLRIREFKISNFGQATSYPDGVFSWFSSVYPRKFRDCTLISSWPLPSMAFPIYLSPIILSFDATYSLSY